MTKKRKKMTPFKTLAEVTVIDLKKNDKFADLGGRDLSELLIELEVAPLVLRRRLVLGENVTFGMEIEFENALQKNVEEKLSKFTPRWEVHSDRSVEIYDRFGRTLGGEVVSPILMDEPKTYRDLEKVCEILRQENAAFYNAGGHIHLGSQIINENFGGLMNFLKTWTAFEEIIFRFAYGDKLGARRDISCYARPIGEQLKPKLSRLARLGNLRALVNELPERRDIAVNFCNFVRAGRAKDTLEFRCPNGSLSPVVWQNNLNFFAKLLTCCGGKNFDGDMVDRKLGKPRYDGNFYQMTNQVFLKDAVNLVDMVFGNNLDKAYFLKQYVKFLHEPKSDEQNTLVYMV